MSESHQPIDVNGSVIAEYDGQVIEIRGDGKRLQISLTSLRQGLRLSRQLRWKTVSQLSDLLRGLLHIGDLEIELRIGRAVIATARSLPTDDRLLRWKPLGLLRAAVTAPLGRN